MSSYVETDDDGNNNDDDEDDDDDGAMFPGGAKFFVKMQSARKRGRYENRQKARQRSHTVDPGTGQDYLVFGALPSQIQLVPNEIKLLLRNIRGTMPKRALPPPCLIPRQRRALDKKDEARRCNLPRGRLLSFVIRSGVAFVLRRERDWTKETMRFPNPADESRPDSLTLSFRFLKWPGF